LPARILSQSPIGASEILVVLALGPQGAGARLLARVTRKSWDHLQLSEGLDVVAQVKGVALAPGRPEQA
jgi:molybdate transport system ATP-binding protein